ncbi:MAG: winged helix-turn-helix domain-containing protein [Rhodospirillales bacterium]|nr:winged helix-turn-helix domain-containing protein [Rhodospirillales bacterium]
MGGILEVSPIHKALCARVGRQVALSTVYDLLHRHGWRKIQPRSRHPKADKEAQADFKNGLISLPGLMKKLAQPVVLADLLSG